MISSNICNVNVGGTQFVFQKTSFEQPHLKDTIIATTVLAKNNDIVPFFDIEPDLFRKWCAPYIRHGLLPDAEALKCPYERSHLAHAANSIGLITLAQFVEELTAKQARETKTKIKISYQRQIALTFSRIISFNGITPNGHINLIECPDASCKAQFKCDPSIQEVNPDLVLSHFYESHNGKATVINTTNNDIQYGIIECDMKNYRKLVVVSAGGDRRQLVHPKEVSK